MSYGFVLKYQHFSTKKKERLKQIQRLPNNQTLSHTAGYKPYFVTAGSIKPEPPVASYFVTF